MNSKLNQIIEHLSLEQLEENLFRGPSRDIGSKRVYGGQVLGQALRAAQHTVDADSSAHSLHAYFLRIGDHNQPIVYEVDRSRDGRSFSARRVVAIQKGRPIFTMAASFHRHEEGLEHQATMPEVLAPPDADEQILYNKDKLNDLPEKLQRMIKLMAPFEFKRIEPINLQEDKSSMAPVRHIWVRMSERLPDDDALHRALLAYISDYSLISVALLPHNVKIGDGKLQIASLDHAMWFHRPFRMDEWLLYSIESPNASQSRGLSQGQFFTESGVLVASTVQEGLIRVREDRTAG